MDLRCVGWNGQLLMLPSIKLTATSNKSDIETYAKVWHRRIEEKFGQLDPKEMNIARIVTARAQGNSGSQGILYPRFNFS